MSNLISTINFTEPCQNFETYKELFNHFIESAQTGSTEISSCREWSQWRARGITIQNQADYENVFSQIQRIHVRDPHPSDFPKHLLRLEKNTEDCSASALIIAYLKNIDYWMGESTSTQNGDNQSYTSQSIHLMGLDYGKEPSFCKDHNPGLENKLKKEIL